MSWYNYAVVKELMPVVFGMDACFRGTFSPFYLSTDYTEKCQMTDSIKWLDESELVLFCHESALSKNCRAIKALTDLSYCAS